MDIASLAATWSPRLLSLLRIIAGLTLLQFGMAKMLGFPAVPSFAHVELLSLTGASGIIELVGGTLLTLGLFARPVAFVLSGEMTFAYFIAHFPRGFIPLVNNGTLPVLFCFVFLYLAAAGPGPWSLDAVLRRRAEGEGQPQNELGRA
ncbi:MAG: DoxX family protein [Rhodospirillales bacterium]|jgi:putative oxidoreductase|nr:DoxX family protein [Rhodospirillales bacterium]